MRTISLKAKALACTFLAGAALTATPAWAQVAAPPVRQSVDANGVDLFWGTVNVDAPALTVGQGAAALDYHMLNRGAGWTDNITATIHLSGSTITVNLGDSADSFTVSGGSYTPTEGNGASLAYNATSQVYTYTRADGTVMHLDKHMASATASEGRVTDIAGASGNKLVFAYDLGIYCKTVSGSTCTLYGAAYRVASIRNAHGYRLGFSYASDTIDDLQRSPGSWAMLTGVSASNLAGGTIVRSESFDTETYVGSLLVTDAMARTTRYRSGTSDFGITLPGSSSEDVTYAYTSGRVTGVTTAAGTTGYAAADASGVRTVTVTDPLSHASVYTFDIASARMTAVTDALSHTIAFQYDSNGRPTRVTAPEGNIVQTTYDARGNVTESRAVAKSGSGVADIVATAAYPSSCTSLVTCNKPTSTTDARGNTADYTYDTTHGGLLTVTAPAPTTGATRPQARYGYSQLQAYFDTGSGIVASGEPVWVLTSTSACQTGASCSGTADEVKTTIGYGPQTTGTGNNLLPASVSKGAGDASLTATTAIAHDDVGNVASVDGPLAGSADTTTYRYDSDRERVGAVSPDPDGSGALKNRAVKVTYNALGQATKVEQGTVNSQSDADWAAFSTLQETDTTYDSAHRPATQSLVSGTTTYALTQTGYDAAGRVTCTAQRMSPSYYGSLPSDACALGTEQTSPDYGPDRIVKATWDAVNRVAVTTSAYEVTGVQSDEVTTAYTANGRVASVTDAEGNKTSYVYDGQDRLSQTLYPSGTKGAGTSNSADYEQLSYETTAGGTLTSATVASIRNRAGETASFSHDALGRTILKDLPGTEPDVTYSYDLLGRLTGASQTGSSLAFTFDALGRQLTETRGGYTYASGWDLAGRRTRLTHPDGFYVDQDYLVTGELAHIRENGATSGVGVLATFAYDDLGRRSLLTYGDGTTTSYSYDGASRLTQQALDLAGTSSDLTLGFSYNPAGQIVSSTRSNDAYAWGRHYNLNRGYTANGLNQYSAVATLTPTYDARGNLTSDGSTTFGYDSENKLTQLPSGVTIHYDPVGLMDWTGTTTPALIYDKDGTDMTAERTGTGTLLRRTVFGPGADEPLVWYEGSGTTSRRFLHADERGSITAVTDTTGASLATIRYDEYGIPQVTSTIGTPRFLYTGQYYISSPGIYYYKARMYSPTWGRFLQTDPIGYGDGMNGYNYVGSEPLNATDPSGLTPKQPRKAPPPPPPGAICTGSRIVGACGGGGIAFGRSGWSTAGVGGQIQGPLGGEQSGGQWVCTNCGQETVVGSSADGSLSLTVTGANWVFITAALEIAPGFGSNRCNFSNNFCKPGVPTPSSPPEEPTVFTCGIQRGICKNVPEKEYCEASKARLEWSAPGSFATGAADGVQGARQIGSSRFATGLGVAKGIIFGEAIADYVDVKLYCH
jgi:RHS repeat-associated protein